MLLVVNSRSRYARRFASVLSTPTDLKRFSQVPLDSSAASSPLPLATMAAAVLERRWVSMRAFLVLGFGARFEIEAGRPQFYPGRRTDAMPDRGRSSAAFGPSACAFVPFTAEHQDLVGIALPPVARREDLDLVEAPVPRLA